MSIRPVLRSLALLLAVSAVLAVPAPASAHPLGSTTVNHYDELSLRPDGVVDQAVVDTAEIPTFQRRDRVDADHDGALTPADRRQYAAASCAAMAKAVELRVAGDRVPLQTTASSYVERPGQGGLPVGRLECSLLAKADLSVPRDLSFENSWDSSVVGWHEVVARGDRVRLEGSPFPAATVSQRLLAYPDDLLGSPLDVRGGTLRVVPGTGASSYAVTAAVPGAGPVARALASVSGRVNDAVGRDHLTVGVGLLGVLLAMLVGGGHALLPGHGKTVMAAYLVGRRGRRRDVLAVGATVTLTHTVGVLVLGLLLTTGVALAPATVERYLGVVSGLVIASVGIGLLVAAMRRRRRPSAVEEPVLEPVLVGVGGGGLLDEPARDHHEHHDHHGPRGHTHGHGHSHAHPSAPFSRSGLVGLGVAGGLVPSPSALLVLLAAVSLGRTAFGVLLVFAYGLGMALVLCLTGLLLVRVGGRLSDLVAASRRPAVHTALSLLPLGTALLLVLVGGGLALRAGAG